MDPSYDPVAGRAHLNQNPWTPLSNASALPAGGSTETGVQDMLMMLMKLAHGNGTRRRGDGHPDILDIDQFVGRMGLRFLTSSYEEKRSFLLSLNENDQVRAAAALLDTPQKAGGEARKSILAKLRLNISSALDAFEGWGLSWGAVLTGYTSNEDAVRSLSEESKRHFVHDWQRALVFIFGELPELWRLPTVPRDRGTAPLDPAQRAGKAIEIINVEAPAPQVVRPSFRRIAFMDLKTPESLKSELAEKEERLQRGRRGIAATSQAQPGPAGHTPSPSSLPMHGNEQPRVIDLDAPTPPVSAAPTPPVSAAPTPPVSAAPTPPVSAAPNPAVSASHLRGSSSSRPPHARPPAATGRPSLLSNIDLTPLAEDLETGIRFPIAELAPFADAIVDLTRGVRTPANTGRGSPSDWFGAAARQAPAMSQVLAQNIRRWSFLVREYLNIKEEQAAELWAAARYIRQWHSVYLELKLYLYGQEIEIPADVQAQAERMLKLTHNLTILVLVRRAQLRPEPEQ